MFGAISVFHSSESADTDEHSSADHVDTENGESDDEDASEVVLAPKKASKLTHVEKICPFRCSLDGFIVCTFCSRAVINADACNSHIKKFHQYQASWLCPILQSECSQVLSVSQIQELYERQDGCRRPFDGILIQDGFKCTECSSTFLSAQTSRRHINDCRKSNPAAMLIPIKCQQPLSWINPRLRLSFQKIFHVSSDEQVSVFPEEIWKKSQSGTATGSGHTNRLNILLNWTTLHCATFPDTQNIIFQNLCALSGPEKWLPKIQKLSDDYFQLLQQTIVNVENAGGARDLCLLRVNSIKDPVPTRGFYWLGAGSIPKYKSCLARVVSFVCRLCEMFDLRQLEVNLENPVLERCFHARTFFQNFVETVSFAKVTSMDAEAAQFTLKDFHKVVFLLFSQPISDACKDDMDYFLMQFVRFASLESLKQQRPEQITHLVGCLKYICRAAILIEAKSLHSFHLDVLCDRLQACNLLKYTMRDQPSIFDKICHINSICFSVIVSESDVILSGDKLVCAVRRQIAVKLNSLQEMVAALLCRARELMRTLVPTSFKTPRITDNDCIRTPGYSVFNQVTDSESIKKYILQNNLQDTSAMQLYMRSSEELQKMLCFLCILTSGSPTRGVEMSKWQLSNTETWSRNIFFDSSKNLLYIKYDDTKTSSSRQRDKVYFKFFSPDMTSLLIQYYGWIRPIEKFGATLLQMPSISVSSYNLALFVFDGRASTSGDYSIISRKYTVEYGIPPLGIRDLRQAIIGFSRAWLGDFSRLSSVRDYLEQFVAWQAAHSVSTHLTRYGGNSPIEAIESFYISSVSFMWLLGMNLPSVGMEKLPNMVKRISRAGGTECDLLTKTAESTELTTLQKDQQSKELHHEDEFYAIALELLREMKMSSTAKFRTPLQSVAVVASLQRKEMLYIGPCGVGKSNVFMLPLFLEQRTTAVFLPYALVRRNVHLAAESMGISSILLEMDKSNIDFSQPPKLLVCAVEQIRYISAHLFELSKRNMLSRIVIDEIQCLFTEEYRQVMGEKDWWRSQLAVGVPLIFLSGSFRMIWEKTFEQCMGVMPILREDTVVPLQTTYSVLLKSDQAQMYDFILNCYMDIVANITKSPTKRHFKCMVFVPMVDQVDKVIQAMQERCRSNPEYASAEFVGYTSKDSPEKQMSSYQKWIRGSSILSVFVCTHAGAVGIDPPPDVNVYHLQAVWSIVSYFQAAGRSGRGSCPGNSLFITSRAALSTFLTKYKVPEHDAADILSFVTTTNCKRRWLSAYFDSKPCPPCHVAGALCSSCLVVKSTAVARQIINTSAVPADPSVPQREARALALSFSRGDQVVSLIRMFSSFKETEWCGICYIFRRERAVHKLNVCPLMCNGGNLICFRCAGNHVFNNCTVTKQLPAGRVCFTCGCEYKVGAFDMHPFGSQCVHGARDRLLISCWFAKRHPDLVKEELRSKYQDQFEMSDEDFRDWLIKFDQTIFLYNNLRMFGELMEWSFRYNDSF